MNRPWIPVLGLVAALGLAPGVNAQSTNVPFSGDLPMEASFSPVVTGETELDPLGGSSISLNRMESAVPATVTITVATPATLTVSEPVLSSGPTPDPSGTVWVGFARFGTTEVRSDVGGGNAPLPAGASDLEVDIEITRPQPYTPGTYTYTVTLILTP